MNKFMTVTEIDNQGDRILLYGSDKGYHVIAGVDIKVKNR